MGKHKRTDELVPDETMIYLVWFCDTEIRFIERIFSNPLKAQKFANRPKTMGELAWYPNMYRRVEARHVDA